MLGSLPNLGDPSQMQGFPSKFRECPRLGIIPVGALKGVAGATHAYAARVINACAAEIISAYAVGACRIKAVEKAPTHKGWVWDAGYKMLSALVLNVGRTVLDVDSVRGRE